MGLKYFFNFTSDAWQGIATYDYRVNIYIDGYSGDPIEVCGGGNPFSEKEIVDNELPYGVKACRYNIEIVESTISIEDFYTEEGFSHKVELVDYTNDYTVIRSGYLISEDVKEEYQDGIKVLQITGTDGLELLKTIPYEESENKPFAGVKTPFDIIKFCLDKISLELGYVTSLPLYLNETTPATNVDTLKLVKIYTELFNEDNCYTVLEKICETLKLSIYIEDNKWYIVNNILPEGVHGYAVEYDYSGNAVASYVFDSSQTVQYDNDPAPLNADKIKKRSYKSVTTTVEVKEYVNKLKNPDFLSGSTYWDLASLDSYSFGGNGTKTDPYHIQIDGYQPNNAVAFLNIKTASQEIVELWDGNGDISEYLNKTIKVSGSALGHGVRSGVVVARLLISTNVSSVPYLNMVLSDSGEWIPMGIASSMFQVPQVDWLKQAIRVKLTNADGTEKEEYTRFSVESKNIADIIVKTPNIWASVIPILGEIIKTKITVDNFTSVKLILGLTEGLSRTSTTNAPEWVRYSKLDVQIIDKANSVGLKKDKYITEQSGVSPNKLDVDAVFGDYHDKDQFLTVLKTDGITPTNLWKDVNGNNTGQLHQSLGRALLSLLAKPTTLYDGDILGRVRKYERLSIYDFDRKLINISWNFNFCKNIGQSVRYVMLPSNYVTVTNNKYGVYNDDREIKYDGLYPPAANEYDEVPVVNPDILKNLLAEIGDNTVFSDGYVNISKMDNIGGIRWFDSAGLNTDWINSTVDGFEFKSSASEYKARLDLSNLTADAVLSVPDLATDADIATSITAWMLGGNTVTAKDYIGTISGDYDIGLKRNNTEIGTLVSTGLALPLMAAITTDTDKFVVNDGGVLKYQTGTNVLKHITDGLTASYIPKADSTSGLVNSVLYAGTNGVAIGTTTLDFYSQGGTNPAFITLKSDNPRLTLVSSGTNPAMIGGGNETIRRGNIWFSDGSNIDFYTNSSNSGNATTHKMRLSSGGSLGLGTTSLTGISLAISKQITGAIAAYGIENNGIIQPDVTTSVRMFRSIPQMAAGSYTLGLLAHFGAYQSMIGAGATLTNQYGFLVDSSLTGAINNYGFYSGIASGSNRWSIYTSTAQSYFGGFVGIGSSRSVPTTALDINGQIAVSLGNATSPAYTFFGDLNNGWFSPAADTQAWSVGGSEVMRLNNAGSLGLGTTSLAGVNLRISKSIVGSGGVIGYGVLNDGKIQSDVTTSARYFQSTASTAASVTIGQIRHFQANQGTFGAGSSASLQIGFYADPTLIGAISNYGFYGDIPAATNRWNTHNAGTAQNYFRGNVGIGVGKTTPSVELDVDGTIATTNLKITSGASVGKYWVCTNTDGTGAWTTVADSYLGTWNANTNTPTIANGTGTTGQWYRVTTAGTWNSITFAVGDDVKYNGTVWEKIPGQGYTLQTASASVLGGIKVGTGLTIDSGTGVLSVSYGTTSTTVAAGNHTHTFSSLTGIPTTVSGYGLTINTSDITGLSSYASFSAYTTTSALTTLLSGKSNTGHTHAFSEITSTPTTATGYGIVLVASDIPSLGWSKITTGKPTTLSGYGITDAQSVLNGTGYVKLTGTTLSYINKEFVDTTTDQTIYGQKIFRDSFKVGNSLFNIQTGQPETEDNDLKFDFITDATSFNYSISDIDDNIGTLFSIQGDFAGTNIRTDISTDLYIYRIVDSNLSTGTNKQILRTDASGILNWTTIDGSYISNWSAKQDALNGTGFVKANGTTITYDNSTYLTTSVAATTYQPLDADLTSISALTGDGVLRKVSNVWNLDTDMYLTTDTKIYFIATATQVGLVNPGTTLTVNGLGNLNLKSGIVTTGTYRSVTVDTYGRVTAGTNPTTVAGYGLTDVWTKTESDARYLLQSSYNPSWGSITGTIGAQADLISKFNEYVTKVGNEEISGNKTFTGSLSNFKNGFSSGDTSRLYFASNQISALTNLFAAIQLKFYGSDFLFSNGNVKIGGTTVATEKLEVAGNIRYSGTLKPSNTTPSVGQFLKAGSTTTNEWATLTTSDISGLSSYTGFTNYTTNDGIAALVDSIIPSGTSGHFLTRDSEGALTFMNIDIDPVMLSANKIAVGSPQGILTEVAGFEFVDKRYLSITRKGYADQKITIGHGTNSQHALFDVQGGRMELNSNIGIRFNNLAGADTRMMVVNASGDISTQAIPTGGSNPYYLPSNRIAYGSASNTQTSDDALKYYPSTTSSLLQVGLVGSQLSLGSQTTGAAFIDATLGINIFGHTVASLNATTISLAASTLNLNGVLNHNNIELEWVTTTINGQTRQVLCKKL